MTLVLLLVFLHCVYATLTLFDEFSSTWVDLSERFVSTSQFQKFNAYTNQPYVANGLFGSRIPSLGFGFTYDQSWNKTSSSLSNGWPLFNKRYAGAFVAGFFDSQPNTSGTNFPELLHNGGFESVVSSIPQWTDLSFTMEVNGAKYTLDPKRTDAEISRYNQSLNMSNGVVTTSYRWMDLVDFNISIYAHAELGHLGVVQISLSPVSTHLNVTVEQFLTLDSCERCVVNRVDTDDGSIFIEVSPTGVPYKHAAIYSMLELDVDATSNVRVTNISVSESFRFELVGPTNFIKYVGIASSDTVQNTTRDAVLQTSKDVVEAAKDVGCKQLLNAHNRVWNTSWGDTNVSILSDPFTQLSVEGSIYHLLASTRASSTGLASGLSVSGLSSDSYAGLVFWDMDLWIIPALIPISPERAVAAFKYRSYMHGQAKRNAQQWGYNGSLYPWTSGGFGNCTGTGPCVNYEYHLNFAITYSIWKLYLSGAISEQFLADYGWPILKDTAEFFVDYVEWNESIGKYETFNLTDPDEYANFQNNGAYTNVGISQSLKWAILVADILGYDINEKWLHVMENMKLPTSHQSNITLEYDGMKNDLIVKQADVVLINYLDDQDHFLPDVFGYDRERAFHDLVYYAFHQTSQGPAMSFPVYGAVAQKLDDVGCGFQTYLRKSYEPFIRFPFIQMSEQNNDDYDVNGGTHPAFPFNTGHAGVIQGFYYGLLGIRYSYQIDEGFERVLHIDPVKIPLFKGDIKIGGFKYMNESIDITVNETHVNLKKETATPMGIYVDHRNELGGFHELIYKLDIPLFVPKQNFQGSVTECSSQVSAVQRGVDGDVAQSIIDGDNSTTWQSSSKDTMAELLVDLYEERTFSKGVLVWGSRPPREFSIFSLDSRESVPVSILSENKVEITTPYVHNSPVKLYERNYTVFDFKQHVTSRYVLLAIEGVLDDDNDMHGGEIAEFALM